MQQHRSTFLFIFSLLLICCLIQIPLLNPSIESGKEELTWIAAARFDTKMTNHIKYPNEYWDNRIAFLINRTYKQELLQKVFWTLGVSGMFLLFIWFKVFSSEKKMGNATHPAWYIMLSMICLLFSFITWYVLLNAFELNNEHNEWHEIYFKLTWFSSPICMTVALLIADKQSNSWSIITPRKKRIIGIVWACSVVLFIVSLMLYAYGSVVNGYDLH
jgi:hypothetical protein